MNVFDAQQTGSQDAGGAGVSLDADARAWVRLLASGRARKEDARKLELWCAASAAHAAAFKKAHALWRQLGTAAELSGAGDPELEAIRRAARYGRAAPATRSGRTSRRAFLGGAVAASVAAAGVALVYPPLSLWPSMAALQADYRTGVGQQMQVALASDVSLLLNTRSSISVRSMDGAPVGIELIDGEIAVSANRPFLVRAGHGAISAEFSRFEVRHLGANVCVTCMEGQVNVALAGARQTVRANQQMVYGGDAAAAMATVDAQRQSDWRQGILSFRQTALAQVIDEINRYRPGHLMLMAKSLEQRPVSGRFRIDDLDKAIAQIQRLFRLSATSLPGGIVMLS